MESNNQKMIRLVSNDQKVFEVPEKVALMSQMVRETLDVDDDEDATIDTDAEVPEVPLPNVSSPVLDKVIQYCSHYALQEAMSTIQTPLKSSRLEDLVQPFYVDFVRVERTMLFDLVAAANYMNIKTLLDLTCLAVSILIRGKSAQELRTMFNMSEQFTDQEEARIAEENQWVQHPDNNNNNETEENSENIDAA